jgi:hypothetical protein
MNVNMKRECINMCEKLEEGIVKFLIFFLFSVSAVQLPAAANDPRKLRRSATENPSLVSFRVLSDVRAEECREIFQIEKKNPKFKYAKPTLLFPFNSPFISLDLQSISLLFHPSFYIFQPHSSTLHSEVRYLQSAAMNGDIFMCMFLIERAGIQPRSISEAFVCLCASFRIGLSNSISRTLFLFSSSLSSLSFRLIIQFIFTW